MKELRRRKKTRAPKGPGVPGEATQGQAGHQQAPKGQEKSPQGPKQAPKGQEKKPPRAKGQKPKGQHPRAEKKSPMATEASDGLRRPGLGGMRGVEGANE